MDTACTITVAEGSKEKPMAFVTILKVYMEEKGSRLERAQLPFEWKAFYLRNASWRCVCSAVLFRHRIKCIFISIVCQSNCSSFAQQQLPFIF